MSVAHSPEPGTAPAPIATPGEPPPYFVLGTRRSILVYFVGAEEGVASLVLGHRLASTSVDDGRVTCFGFPCH